MTPSARGAAYVVGSAVGSAFRNVSYQRATHESQLEEKVNADQDVDGRSVEVQQLTSGGSQPGPGENIDNETQVVVFGGVSSSRQTSFSCWSVMAESVLSALGKGNG